MRSVLAFAAVLAVASPAFAAVALAPRSVPSGTPSCPYTCPSTDNSGFIFVGAHAVSSTSVRCDYYAVDLDVATYTCTYNTQVRPLGCRVLHRAYTTQTGALTTDHDGGFCRKTATKGKCSATRDARDVEGQYEAYKRRAAVRAASPAPAVPTAINVRAKLGKRKLMGKGIW
jgi:hypothetical protein